MQHLNFTVQASRCAGSLAARAGLVANEETADVCGSSGGALDAASQMQAPEQSTSSSVEEPVNCGGEAFGDSDMGSDSEAEDPSSLLEGVSCLAMAPTHHVNNSKSLYIPSGCVCDTG